MENVKLKKIVAALGTGLSLAVLQPFPVYAQPDTENYGVADVSTALNIRQDADTQSAVIGSLPANGVCRILQEEGGWANISSGEITGYVDISYLYEGHLAKAIVENIGEEHLPVAEPVEETVEEGQETVQTMAVPVNGIGQQVVDFALQFVGNPYVWGGTSLTQGADCSGFVQSVYDNFGVSLPRVAEDQAYTGVKIPVEQAQPGDLIFYEDESGYIYHVVLYMGDGKVVHASSSSTGIKVSDVYYAQAAWAVRVI